MPNDAINKLRYATWNNWCPGNALHQSPLNKTNHAINTALVAQLVTRLAYGSLDSVINPRLCIFP